MVNWRTHFVCVAAAVTASTACSANSQSALGPSQSIFTSKHGTQFSERGIPSPVARGSSLLVRKPYHGKPWIDAGAAKGQALLYVSNGSNGTVDIYKYQFGKNPTPAGELTGFTFPAAPCSDNAGNVFVPDFVAQTVTEYAYGATTPTQTLTQGGSAISCSVDPKTDNLAVVNFPTMPSDDGYVAVYADETGTPTTYTNPNQQFPEFAGYDNNSNLWISGRSASIVYNMGELANGASSIVTATINGATIYFPAQVQWGGTYLLVGDQEFNDQAESGLYQMSINGSTLTAHGSFVFAGAQDVLGFYKRGSVPNASIVAPDFELGSTSVYDFPAGRTLSSFSSSGSYGAAVAQKSGR